MTPREVKYHRWRRMTLRERLDTVIVNCGVESEITKGLQLIMAATTVDELNWIVTKTEIIK